MTIRMIAVAAVLAGVVWTGAAWADPQTAAAPPPAPPTPAAAPAPAPSAQNGVVTVTGPRPLPAKKCGTHDQVCITAVIERIWADHLPEVRAFCLREDMRLTQNRFMFEKYAAPGDSPVDSSVPDSERQLCDYGRKHHIK